MGKSAPPPPDFKGAANQQAAGSQQAVGAQTQANRPGQSTPFAQNQWTQGPDGQWQQNVGYGAGLQGTVNGLQGMAGQSLGQPIMNGDAARNQAITAAYNQATSRLNPQFDQQESNIKSQLANQGLDPSSEAYRNALREFGQSKNDAFGSAMNSAIGQGTAAGSAVFGQNMAAREAPLNELAGLQGFLAMPGFNAAGASQAPQTLGAAEAGANYGLQNQANQNQFWGNVMGGLTGLAGGIAGLPFGFGKGGGQQAPVPGVVGPDQGAQPGPGWSFLNGGT